MGLIYIVFWVPNESTQPLAVKLDSGLRPIVGLIAEAQGVSCQFLGLVIWNTTFSEPYGHRFPEGLDVRDKGRFCSAGLRSDARLPLFLFFKYLLTFFWCVALVSFNTQAFGSNRGRAVKWATAVIRVV